MDLIDKTLFPIETNNWYSFFISFEKGGIRFDVRNRQWDREIRQYLFNNFFCVVTKATISFRQNFDLYFNFLNNTLNPSCQREKWGPYGCKNLFIMSLLITVCSKSLTFNRLPRGLKLIYYMEWVMVVTVPQRIKAENTVIKPTRTAIASGRFFQ